MTDEQRIVLIAILDLPRRSLAFDELEARLPWLFQHDPAKLSHALVGLCGLGAVRLTFNPGCDAPRRPAITLITPLPKGITE